MIMGTMHLSPDWSKRTILIAEDVDSNYTVLEALLRQTQVHVLRAHNGLEAIEMISKQVEIDLVLMDLSMPKMNGIEALQQIRQQMPDKIVIVQTAHDISEEIVEAKFDDILQKPISRNNLIQLLSKYLV